MANADQSETPAAGQRLDKWLWFARVIKSRTQAAGLVTDGKVRVNRARVDKPAVIVKPGDVITVTVRGSIRVLKVTAPGVRRGPPAEARDLYEEVAPPAPPAGAPGTARSNRLQAAGAGQGERTAGSGRPTKRDRRQLTRLIDNNDG